MSKLPLDQRPSSTLKSSHARFQLCKDCEQALAHVTCKADDAALCVTWDRVIYFGNPLNRHHERAPVMPFYDSVNSTANSIPAIKSAVKFFHDLYFSDMDGETETSREEVEAVLWLLSNPKAQDGQFL
ncbi:zinc finger protein CONSTANS-LIKE 4-like [Pyrus x bretschneideri]|uniref:zinc finger protein CONSTANS-LIKE 4-like n=1 Tax=Pyrus x bretschneideri TaxID=225117 RepID=UPI0005107B62|nr:zinc finger protein CONSTANS-LIKE 4-like [Pyrus x bretschneideri]